MHRVDLNVDLGELPDEPEELYRLATVVNVACGGHAGDDASMRRAVALAMKSGAAVAAHPSFPDREGFGRRAMTMPADALRGAVASQCAALAAVAAARGATVLAVKPHGALYHEAARDGATGLAVIEGARAALGDAFGVVGPPGGELAELARARGLAYAREGFADRRYRHDGALVPRTEPDALLTEPAACAAQAVLLARSGTVDTLCVHGDTAGAVVIARAVRKALEQADLLRGAP